MTRAEAIEILKKLMEAMQLYATVLPTPEKIAAIRFAIASLETDEAYQLEYERMVKATWQQINKNEVNVIPQ